MLRRFFGSKKQGFIHVSKRNDQRVISTTIKDIRDFSILHENKSGITDSLYLKFKSDIHQHSMIFSIFRDQMHVNVRN